MSGGDRRSGKGEKNIDRVASPKQEASSHFFRSDQKTVFRCAQVPSTVRKAVLQLRMCGRRGTTCERGSGWVNSCLDCGGFGKEDGMDDDT
uniref:Uncharacterized protein n=1 Tax=Steinernema glaseri TaxID=37863 RepID=A0A1I7YCL1_9BILA